MQTFKPVLQKFKNAFFDGGESDPECGKPARAPPRPRAGRVNNKNVVHEVINLHDSDEEQKEPANRKRKAPPS